MKTKLFSVALLFILSFFSTGVMSQTVKGKVYGVIGESKEFIDGATVVFTGTNIGTLTDEKGFFELENTDNYKSITVSMIGYESDTIEITSGKLIFVHLRSNLTTEQIEVEENRNSKFTGKEIIPTESLTLGEFKKAPSCDLAGCFGSSVTVESKTTDAIFKLKELKILGLDGQYSQILFDGIPIFSGLNAKYGMGSIPGSMLAAINISKGTNSVLQGAESMSGIINVIPRDFNSSEKVFLNLYMNDMLERQINLNTAHKFENWSTILSGHLTGEAMRMDYNRDGFLDAPLVYRNMIYNKWTYDSPAGNFKFELAGKYNSETKTGGEQSFNESSDKWSDDVYGQVIDFKIYDLYSKAGRTFENGDEIKFFAGFSRHDNNSYLGTLEYIATQNIFWTSGFYSWKINSDAKLNSGLSYRFDHLTENITMSESKIRSLLPKYENKEHFPGIFSELDYTNILKNLSLLAGVRVDFHNQYGTVVTPRGLLRYQLAENTLLRGSLGTAFRVPKVLIENMNVLSGSKDLLIANNLNPDKLVNFGITLTQDIKFDFIDGTLNLDFYRSDFSSRVISIYDREPGKVFVENLEGNSYSNVFQAEINVQTPLNFSFTGAYKFTDFILDHKGIKKNEPYVPKHQLVATISYATDENDFLVDLTTNWFGKRPLPSTKFNPPKYQYADFSEPYAVVNLQATKVWEMLEIYAGLENIFDVEQKNPIIAADDPFGPYFDTSFVYGPTTGREFYVGIRYKILR
ncbi:MAG: TonB-dependent receptor [Ignavibacteriaceae bacterium]|jgi:outer membrane receptor for ferrienterochelin and colicin|nr:MAG: Outer membrane ferrienterochelin/colicins receptor [Chlorobi bacterium OLB4]MBW7855525.1 TonB-dependent receptor [Ignavibacteria bacterium]MEB2328832.1 TonB-dependent receptor [Ignavibacteriaceae bacterium]OQY77112.1 MAG: hypothetical protein B6D43_08355 [Ignavibacteriales bacterium UTCHB1]